MTEALEQTGRKARLIGQGIPEGYIFFPFTFDECNVGVLSPQFVVDMYPCLVTPLLSLFLVAQH